MKDYQNRMLVVLLMGLFLLLICAVLELMAPQEAHAETLRVYWRQDVPTVPGIEASPSPAPFYRPQVRVNRGPSAGIYYVDPAPPNGCEPAAFRVISGPLSGRGCVGRQ